MIVRTHGGTITVPVGEQVKGRLMNVIGEPIDGMQELNREGAYSIHRKPLSLKIYPQLRKFSLPVSKLSIY